MLKSKRKKKKKEIRKKKKGKKIVSPWSSYFYFDYITGRLRNSDKSKWSTVVGNKLVAADDQS